MEYICKINLFKICLHNIKNWLATLFKTFHSSNGIKPCCEITVWYSNQHVSLKINWKIICLSFSVKKLL